MADGTKIGESPLVGSAKNQMNLTVFYETDKFLAREIGRASCRERV